MAIIIPSSKTYDRQNPKIRDNVIERIEVGAVEVVPNNEYETPVYNKDLNLTQNLEIEKGTGQTKVGWVVGSTLSSTGSIIYDTYSTISEIKIKKNENNKIISKLLLEAKKDGSFYTGVSKTFSQTIYKYNVSDSLTFTGDETNTQKDGGYFDFEKIKRYSGTKEVFEAEKVISDLNNLFIEFNWNGSSFDINISDNIRYTLSTDVVGEMLPSYDITTHCNLDVDEPYKNEELEWEEDDEYFTIKNIKVLRARDLYSCANTYNGNVQFNNVYPSEVVQIKQEVKKAEITIYGNTIGIDLVDKTVYINGETAKKVHRIDGNELMQTSNYYLSTGTDAIKRAFTTTQTDYAKGKETATIRCSISDYFDTDGDKAISIDKSTGKMRFEVGDTVIPMVYGADRNDHPISKDKSGYSKVFKVLGAKPFYDGAVWQELTLQEVNEENQEGFIEQLVTPTLKLEGSLLVISNVDVRATNIEIFANGEKVATTNSSIYELANLRLPVGSYTITAKAVSQGYDDSQASNEVVYVVYQETFGYDVTIDGMSIFETANTYITENAFAGGYEQNGEEFVWNDYALRISAPAENLNGLTSGQEMTIYPFVDGNELHLTYRLIITDAKTSIKVVYTDRNGVEQTKYIGQVYPMYIDFYYQNNVGRIKVTYGGMIENYANIDFSYGVKIVAE